MSTGYTVQCGTKVGVQLYEYIYIYYACVGTILITIMLKLITVVVDTVLYLSATLLHKSFCWSPSWNAPVLHVFCSFTVRGFLSHNLSFNTPQKNKNKKVRGSTTVRWPGRPLSRTSVIYPFLRKLFIKKWADSQALWGGAPSCWQQNSGKSCLYCNSGITVSCNICI